MKESLIMIPGTLCDGTLFEDQVEGLKDLADCRVLSNSSSDDLKEVAANILLEAEDTFSIMGLSYGGIIAFEIWRQAPERINKEPSEATRLNQQRFVGMSHLGEFREITTGFLKDAMLHPDHARLPEMREAVLSMALNTGKENFYRQIKAQLARPDSTDDLPNISCPTLIMTGREDKVCTAELHQEMARMIPNSTLHIIEKCGHLSTMEQPEQVNKRVREWWTGLAN
jgi:pimeloyl-ACP methyl ester carboxylesterase